jgi:hypothetical protein
MMSHVDVMNSTYLALRQLRLRGGEEIEAELSGAGGASTRGCHCATGRRGLSNICSQCSRPNPPT